MTCPCFPAVRHVELDGSGLNRRWVLEGVFARRHPKRRYLLFRCLTRGPLSFSPAGCHEYEAKYEETSEPPTHPVPPRR